MHIMVTKPLFLIRKKKYGDKTSSRCRELDRYVNRLVKHPVIRKDPDFRTFLQEGKLAATLDVRKGVGRTLTDAFSGLSQV